ncbi:ketose-bisphosphate aldolase [candidate division KSB3 bacterium]|uniref:Ketose-bisphosphate aldolase n=1 Tax=candidate division KSB3 bacterium TaxID=2044937 RepID=A0A9D5K0C7_9BACT|nr:ketose-bisphosphate aldolase [candidate division KSB3 bacterium]MBD3327632.1 ketose-bisphosphate aldolase [candidate division KSB3 bacterium]
MEIVNSLELLQDAYRNQYAVGAFNISNMENIQSVLEAAEELQAPALISAARQEVIYANHDCLVEMVQSIARKKKGVIGIHLDHCTEFGFVLQCIRYGFTSVMFDGSLLSFDDNVETTRKVVEFAHAVGVSVEGELGTIGHSTEMGEKIEDSGLTKPEDAQEFVERTGVDFLATSFGTAHGLYKAEPNLDFDRLEAIATLTKIPLVMHGGTGVPRDQIKKAIARGICKINYSTVLRKAFLDRMTAYMTEHPDDLMTINIFGDASNALKQSVKEMMELCGSVGKA